MSYIQSNKTEDGCAFCNELAKEDGPENLIVHRGKYNFVILNRYPYTSGHLMVVPYEHLPSIEELDADTRSEMMELGNRCLGVLRDCVKSQGFNLGLNIGDAGGAGILDHVHLHIVPRWIGDTNFMSSLGETRVVPETLEETYFRVRGAWQIDSLSDIEL
jgi:ATP adenylyltransferase